MREKKGQEHRNRLFRDAMEKDVVQRAVRQATGTAQAFFDAVTIVSSGDDGGQKIRFMRFRHVPRAQMMQFEWNSPGRVFG